MVFRVVREKLMNQVQLACRWVWTLLQRKWRFRGGIGHEGTYLKNSTSTSPSCEVPLCGSMALCEYKERRNARLRSQREELQKLLENSAFSNPTWNQNLLNLTSEGEGREGPNTTVPTKTRRRSVAVSKPLRRSSRQKWAMPVYIECIFCRETAREETVKHMVSALLYCLPQLFRYLRSAVSYSLLSQMI
jgi:hypothetical protein